jgi:hypothetical protein
MAEGEEWDEETWRAPHAKGLGWVRKVGPKVGVEQ